MINKATVAGIWLSATDAEVSSALRNLQDFEQCAVEVILDEAERRGIVIEKQTEPAGDEPSRSLLAAIHDRVSAFLRPWRVGICVAAGLGVSYGTLRDLIWNKDRPDGIAYSLHGVFLVGVLCVNFPFLSRLRSILYASTASAAVVAETLLAERPRPPNAAPSLRPASGARELRSRRRVKDQRSDMILNATKAGA